MPTIHKILLNQYLTCLRSCLQCRMPREHCWFQVNISQFIIFLLKPHCKEPTHKKYQAMKLTIPNLYISMNLYRTGIAIPQSLSLRDIVCCCWKQILYFLNYLVLSRSIKLGEGYAHARALDAQLPMETVPCVSKHEYYFGIVISF